MDWSCFPVIPQHKCYAIDTEIKINKRPTKDTEVNCRSQDGHQVTVGTLYKDSLQTMKSGTNFLLPCKVSQGILNADT